MNGFASCNSTNELVFCRSVILGVRSLIFIHSVGVNDNVAGMAMRKFSTKQNKSDMQDHVSCYFV